MKTAVAKTKMGTKKVKGSKTTWDELEQATKEKMKNPGFVSALKSHYKALTGKDLRVE